MKKLGIASMLAVAVAWTPTAFSAEMDEGATSDGSSNRMTHRLGIYGTLLGDPWPSLIGANVGYNVMDFFRVHAGLSFIPGVLILGGGGKSIGAGLEFFSNGGSRRGFLCRHWKLRRSLRLARLF